MTARRIENGLALLGVLIILFGVSFAANTAFASEADALGTSLKTAVSTTD
jgi:hypothetical protein